MHQLPDAHRREPCPCRARPKYVVKKGKTPILNADEARALLDSFDISTLTEPSDLALIGIMVYTFARVNGVIRMKVKDYFIQGRAWLGTPA